MTFEDFILPHLEARYIGKTVLSYRGQPFIVEKVTISEIWVNLTTNGRRQEGQEEEEGGMEVWLWGPKEPRGSYHDRCVWFTQYAEMPKIVEDGAP